MRSVFQDMLGKVSDPYQWMAEVAKRLDLGFKKVTAVYTVVDADSVVLADATGGAFAVTLPLAGDAIGKTITVKRLNSGANAVTITAAGSDTIDGSATKALSAQYAMATLVPDPQGGKWHIVSVI